MLQLWEKLGSQGDADHIVDKISNFVEEIHLETTRDWLSSTPVKATEVPDPLLIAINSAAASYQWENVMYYDTTFRQLMAEHPGRNWGKMYAQANFLFGIPCRIYANKSQIRHICGGVCIKNQMLFEVGSSG